jgi:hypothetical protein
MLQELELLAHGPLFTSTNLHRLIQKYPPDSPKILAKIGQLSRPPDDEYHPKPMTRIIKIRSRVPARLFAMALELF